jgi:hypothetical protein
MTNLSFPNQQKTIEFIDGFWFVRTSTRPEIEVSPSTEVSFETAVMEIQSGFNRYEYPLEFLTDAPQHLFDAIKLRCSIEQYVDCYEATLSLYPEHWWLQGYEVTA